MAAPLLRRTEPDTQRLRQHLDQVTGEVQGHEQLVLFEALEPVQAPRRHQ
ncbi:hypothetical protein K4749_14670 [Streptomyces sp. TRM72054]|nr:hypothetical protein [Streptomyces sp. TRM72054]MBX9394808.1 hypothetical protein [Streptomyces sp. TRM72054]